MFGNALGWYRRGIQDPGKSETYPYPLRMHGREQHVAYNSLRLLSLSSSAIALLTEHSSATVYADCVLSL
jgi:hypothetical protein